MLRDFHRGRRLRQSPELRALVRDTPPLLAEDLIMPYFVVETDDSHFRKEISAMPGQYQLSLDELEKQVEKAVDMGLTSVIIFGIPAVKDEKASGAYAENGIVQQAVRRLRKRFPRLVIMTDVCLCEYMSHGHCGILTPEGRVLNDPTLELLAKTAVSQVEAGADVVAPSDMMDGRVAAIREALDLAGHVMTPIMSYAVKYASAYYGPFREAAESAPSCGDRKAYQMDPGNWREAVLEACADVIEEGADALIVKPAGPYSDIIRLVRENVDVPLCAYQVSGEYAMIRAAGMNGWIDEQAVMLESLLGLKRAGAKMLITYFSETLLEKGLVR
ncbi:porphobilinogen synthase [uncultured Desulfovibrio sp.]|uniref:porphobilinogen synthase n=1 Tax=uncultured Desulfovibrio sp. TaxID=167968 RepID=UPI001C3AD2C2|nr:porphobilinogen synthase [uncultured Desulfovibrio sp.]HIX40023.1 porphobilinogen synthase [Candidatus Desulfovibrio intestinigallinarum]